MENKEALLNKEITTLETENVKLRRKVAQLEAELSEMAPRMIRFNETQIEILRYLFRCGRTALEDLATFFGMPSEMINCQFNGLRGAGLVRSLGGSPIGVALYRLTD